MRTIILVINVLAVCTIGRAGLIDTHDNDRGRSVYLPHHADAGHTNDDHFFTATGDDHHFAWFSSTPSSPGPIVVKYDFRDRSGFTNLITAGQRARSVDAFDVWSIATGGRLQFVQDTLAAEADIINVGTGDLAALGSVSGPGGTLGLGGGSFSHGGAVHSITGGIAWQDKDETWDEVLGNGNPGGMFDYFTVVAQEIGHALGLGHIDDVGGLNLMNGSYTVEQTLASSSDIEHITAVYGVTAVPEPGPYVALSCLLSFLFVFSRRRSAVI